MVTEAETFFFILEIQRARFFQKAKFLNIIQSERSSSRLFNAVQISFRCQEKFLLKNESRSFDMGLVDAFIHGSGQKKDVQIFEVQKYITFIFVVYR